ncbi:MAG: hypothetical protein WC797_04490 [Candidatus Paceibacterota bacterium]|jgi:hypothetical protein
MTGNRRLGVLLGKVTDLATGDNAEYWVDRFEHTINGVLPYPAVGSRVSGVVWKTIVVGTYPASSLIAAVKLVGNYYGQIEVPSFQEALAIDKNPEMVDLVKLSVADLGFSKGASYRMICARIKREAGFRFCLAKDAIYTRVVYLDQPQHEVLHFVMERPIHDSRDSGSDRVILIVSRSQHNLSLWFRVANGDTYYGPDDILVLRFPREK